MDFQKFKILKDEIEKLPNVKFESLLGESVLITNKKNQSSFEVPFTTEADGSYTLHLGKAKQVVEGVITEEEQFEANVRKFKNSIKLIFENYDEGIKAVKNCFATFPNIEIKSEFTHNKKTITFEERMDILCNSENEVVKSINSKFRKQISEMHRERKDFAQLFVFFNEDNSIKNHDFNFEKLRAAYNEAYAFQKKFNDHLKKIGDFHKRVETIVLDKELANAIVADINFMENAKISIPKAVVKAKNTFTEAKLKVTDVSRKIIALYQEMFKSGEAEDKIYNLEIPPNDALYPQFLKFSTGKYSREDVQTLEHELEQSFYVLPNLTDEDLRQIADWRNQAMYMHRTNMISDKIVDEIINEFNKRFAVNSSADYSNGDKDLGFKKISDQAMNNGSGIADMSGEVETIKDLEIGKSDEFAMEDDEDFEKQKDAVIA